MVATRRRRSRGHTRRQRKLQKGGKDTRTAPPLRCQCDASCTRPVVKGETFCKYHAAKGCPIKSPLTGAEPEYNPNKYNADESVRHSHNCHAYAMDFIDPEKVRKCREEGNCRFTGPGFKEGHPGFNGKLGKTCGDVTARTMSDVKAGYATTFSSRCEPGFSKIAVVVDEENDFHYYRQDSNGWWSHKPGARHVTNVDAAGARIWNPELASRYYPRESPNDTGLNYNSVCPFMCVPRDGSITLAGGRRSKTYRKRK